MSGVRDKKGRLTRVASSRPQALAMALSEGQKTIAKLRLTMPPGHAISLLG